MKKYLFLAVIIILNYQAFGQGRKFTIQTNPILIFADLISLSLLDEEDLGFLIDLEGQYKINDSFNISLDLSLTYLNDNYYDSSSRDYYDEGIFVMNLRPAFIWRPFKTGLSGFYLGIHPNIGFALYENRGEKDLLTGIGFGFNAGYKWVFKRGFTMQLGSVFGRTWYKPGNSDFEDYYKDIGSILLFVRDIFEFKIGYSF